MGKFWDKVWTFPDDYPMLAAFSFVFLIFLFIASIMGIVSMNVEFWSYQIPTINCRNPSFFGCTGNSQPNLHGFGLGQHLFFSIMIIEIFFILFCMLIKRVKNESSWFYALKNKFYALGVWLILYFILFPLVWLLGAIPYLSILVGVGKFFIVIGNGLLLIWKPALCIIGVFALVGLYYLINVGLSKIFERKK